MSFNTVVGGYEISPSDRELLYNQRAITKQINDKLIQVGAIFLKTSSKNPFDPDGWSKTQHRDTNLQEWVENEELFLHNVGFNLQQGWMDVDIDAEDPEYNQCIFAALNHLGVDSRFSFGRRSVGYPSHLLVQLGEEESSIFEELVRFEPREFRLGNRRFHTQLRSYPTNITATNLARSAKQTVMPGSVYSHKTKSGEYDISVWYTADAKIAPSVGSVAGTTPRRVAFNEVVRAIAFGTFLYLVKNVWVEGSRQTTAGKLTGWLARLVRESRAMNNHEVISRDVFCPVDTDGIVESLIQFVCKFMNDDEAHMRIRAFHDARDKLERNSDAKIPGWPALTVLLGGDSVMALRSVFMPGSDISVLTKLADRYLYDESDNKYIDRERHGTSGNYVHDGAELERRHKGDIIRVGKQTKEAFRIWESSDMRKRIGGKDMFPDLPPGGVFRFSKLGDLLSDEEDGDSKALPLFNTWRGWPVEPAIDINQPLMDDCVAMLDRLLDLLTRDNKHQSDWIKQWFAWTFQHPGQKQQIAWVLVGGQGVGKSFIGNVFSKALMGKLWGGASPSAIDGKFSVEPFIDKMLTFIDEAKFHSEVGTDEIKKLVRSIDISGQEKFGSSRDYRIFSRIIFASNRFDMNISQSNVRDRALFYTRAYDKDYLNFSELAFREWAENLKDFFDDFNAKLAQLDVRQHFVRYFMDYPTDRHTVESIKHSSSSDPDIIQSNMSWSRRVAKYILEDARIFEDIDISHPFTMPDLNRRVVEVCREMGMQPINGQRVLSEYLEAGVLEKGAYSGRLQYRFLYKYSTLLDVFGKSIGTDMDIRYPAAEHNTGPVDPVGARPEPWLGMRDAMFSKKF